MQTQVSQGTVQRVATALANSPLNSTVAQLKEQLQKWDPMAGADFIMKECKKGACVKDKYILQLKSKCDCEKLKSRLSDMQIWFDWDCSESTAMRVSFNGTGKFPLDKLPEIADLVGIEPDVRLKPVQAQSARPQLENACLKSPSQPQQSLWGLDAIDGSFDTKYTFGLTGEGVNIYVIDSGIRTDHPEFEGRASNVFTSDAVRAENTNILDCTGHGTHVSGIAAGHTVGVAKKANLMGLRIIGCEKTGSVSDAVQAIEFLSQNIKKPAVVNMSLGATDGLQGASLPNAIQGLVNKGIPVVIAAGNSALNACQDAPGQSLTQIPGTFVVGALDKGVALSYSPTIASFSNTGTCVKFWAPGEDIWSTSNQTSSGFETRRGTSQAAPFVTGVIALHLQQNPNAQPADLLQALTNQGKALSFGGVHVVAPGTNLAGSTSMTFPLANCRAFVGVLDVMLSWFGGSTAALYGTIAGLIFLFLLMIVCCCRWRRRRVEARKATAKRRSSLLHNVEKPMDDMKVGADGGMRSAQSGSDVSSFSEGSGIPPAGAIVNVPVMQSNGGGAYHDDPYYDGPGLPPLPEFSPMGGPPQQQYGNMGMPPPGPPPPHGPGGPWGAPMYPPQGPMYGEQYGDQMYGAPPYGGGGGGYGNQRPMTPPQPAYGGGGGPPGGGMNRPW